MRLDSPQKVLAVGDVVVYTNSLRRMPLYADFNGHIGFVVSCNEANGYCTVEWFAPVEYPAGKGTFTRQSSFECTSFQKVLNG